MSRLRRVEALEQRYDATRSAIELVELDDANQVTACTLRQLSGASTSYTFDPPINDAQYQDWRRLMKLGPNKPYLADLWEAI